MIDYDAFLSRSAAGDEGVGDSQDGDAARTGPRHRVVRTRLSGARDVPVGGVPGDHRGAARPARTARCCNTAPTRGYRPLLEAIAALMASRGAPTSLERLLVTTGSQQGLDLVARVLLDPGRRDPGRAAELHRRHRRVPEPAGAHGRRAPGSRRPVARASRRDVAAAARRGPARPLPVRRAELPEPDRPADRARQAAPAARVGRAARRADRRGRSVSRSVLRGLGVGSRRAARCAPTTRAGA